MTASGQKLGYIPKIHNHFPSQMIDNGSKLRGQVKKLRWREEGVQVKVMVYLTQ